MAYSTPGLLLGFLTLADFLNLLFHRGGGFFASFAFIRCRRVLFKCSCQVIQNSGFCFRAANSTRSKCAFFHEVSLGVFPNLDVSHGSLVVASVKPSPVLLALGNCRAAHEANAFRNLLCDISSNRRIALWRIPLKLLRNGSRPPEKCYQLFDKFVT